MMTKKNLAKAVTLSVLLMLPYGMAQAATTYTEAISGADDKYTEPQKTYNDSTKTYTYTLGDGAVLDLETNNADRNANTIGIHANNEKIVINGALDIKMQKGEENNSGSVRNAILVEGTNSLVDRRAGGNIEISASSAYDNSAVLLKGSNNKIYFGKGDITLTTNKGTPTPVLTVTGNDNLLVYGGNDKITHYANGNDDYSRGIGVQIEYDDDKNNNKIILGYAGDYSDADLEKFNSLDMLPNVINDLETVTIEIISKNDNTERNADVLATGIEMTGFSGTADKSGNNVIAAGDLIIKTTAEGKGNAEGNNYSSAYGISNSNAVENTTNSIFAKSVDIESTIKVDQAHLVSAYGVYNLSSAGKTLVEITNKSKIDVKSETNGNSNISINGIYNANKYIYEGEIIQEGDEAIVNTTDIDITTNSTGGTVENVGIRADGGNVTVNGSANISANASGAAEGSKVYGLWSTFGGNITINGKTTISTSGGQDIAVVAGTENWTDVNAEPDGGTNNINLNYGAGSNIKGDIISGYGGNITIGNTIGNAETGISTLSTRNNAGTLKLTGDALSANGGKLSINLTSGSTWTGRADDYQDADLKEQVESGFFNPKFSHEIAASGTVNVNLAEGARWDVTGQSWLTKLEGTGGVIDMRNGVADDTSHAVHIGDLEGSHTFVMDLDTEHSVSDMLFIKGNAGGEQKLWINSINGLENLKDGDSLRFATVNSENLTFSGDYNFGSYGNAKNGIMLADNGVMNNAFVIKSEKYDVNDSKKENEGYNGGTEFDEVKPGDEYVDENYADATNWLLAKDSSGDKVSDAGKTIINMSKVNYNNAIYMDRLNKRLGEARYISPEDEQGMWVRIRHDRIGKDDAFRSQNTMYEMGYDVKQDCDNGERRVGMAIDYMDGKAEYTGIAGDGDVKRYGLWLYDTWLGDKGHYTDYVLKWGHLENDFDIMARTTGEKITGDYSNNVFSASAEYGKKNDMGGGWYFEPQAQLQFARVTGADYVTSQDTKVSLDGINSLIGRAGFRLGRDLNENSTVYIKADLLHEFLGDQDITATDITGTLREEYENEGTWYDVGFGFATALGNNSYAFMDFEKSFGNDNDETYQINAGVQWTF